MSYKYVVDGGSFVARTLKGEPVKVNILQEMLEGHTSSGPYRVKGLQSMETDEGVPVNRIEKGKYRTVGFDEVDLVSDDPNAV